MSLRSCNFLFGHLPGRTSLSKFTFKEGHITDKTLGIPPCTDASTATLYISHAWDKPISNTGASVPPRNKPNGDKDKQR
jgi:hypothetical protein